MTPLPDVVETTPSGPLVATPSAEAGADVAEAPSEIAKAGTDAAEAAAFATETSANADANPSLTDITLQEGKGTAPTLVVGEDDSEPAIVGPHAVEPTTNAAPQEVDACFRVAFAAVRKGRGKGALPVGTAGGARCPEPPRCKASAVVSIGTPAPAPPTSKASTLTEAARRPCPAPPNSKASALADAAEAQRPQPPSCKASAMADVAKALSPAPPRSKASAVDAQVRRGVEGSSGVSVARTHVDAVASETAVEITGGEHGSLQAKRARVMDELDGAAACEVVVVPEPCADANTVASPGVAVVEPIVEAAPRIPDPNRNSKAAWRNWKPAFAATPYVWEPMPQPTTHDIANQQHGRGGELGGRTCAIDSNDVCWEWKQGRCLKGAMCKWAHAVPLGGVVLPGQRPQR